MEYRDSIKTLADLPKPLSYQFNSMRIMEYRANTADDLIGVQVQFKFDVKCVFGVSVDPPFVIVMPEVTCTLLDDPSREMCYLKIQAVFPVDGIDAYIINNEVTLPEEFSSTLINLALGALRGILFAKNLGMSYSNTVMPPMSLTDLLPKESFRLANESQSVRILTPTNP